VWRGTSALHSTWGLPRPRSEQPSVVASIPLEQPACCSPGRAAPPPASTAAERPPARRKGRDGVNVIALVEEEVAVPGLGKSYRHHSPSVQPPPGPSRKPRDGPKSSDTPPPAKIDSSTSPGGVCVVIVGMATL